MSLFYRIKILLFGTWTKRLIKEIETRLETEGLVGPDLEPGDKYLRYVKLRKRLLLRLLHLEYLFYKGEL